MRYLFLLLFTINLFSYDRVVALSPAINEIIYALDDGKKIVGNTTFCNYPKDAKQKPKVGGYFTPSLEKIISLKPDIVIMQSSSVKLAQKLNKLGITTKIVKLNKLNDIKNTIRDIGNILDKNKQAKIILGNLESKLLNTKNIIKNKKILIVIGHNLKLDKRIFVAGKNLYFDDIINFSGNTNAFQNKKVGQPILNMENIIALNPDIVILLAPYMQQKGLKKNDLINPWLSLPIHASQTKAIYVLSEDYAGISSHRLSLFLDDFKEYLLDAKTR
ncbi:Vitamin B12 ABC transporter, B12-binding component BtuF [hydrothermal vent metagenome]|uniref:Vitamin B12 ABC transporter, B12-binding component BtuF n=1 Tax=hydrothermal vent metagenome TaxID=652676 RepID=A0A3B1DWG4_9ZZZZ